MRRLHKQWVRGLVVTSSLVVLASCGGAGGRGGARFGSGFTVVPATPEIQALEHEMHELLNRDRAAGGLPSLQYDERLAEIARAHSADMRDHGFFAHESPRTGSVEDRVAAAGYLALEVRENLAEAPRVDLAEEGLMNSPKHHANIMSPTVTHVGVGIVRGGVEQAENLTFTQVFARPGEVESPSLARDRIRQALAAARAERALPPLRANPKLDSLAQQQVQRLPREPTPSALKKVGKAVTEELAAHPIEGVSGVSVAGQLLWQSEQFMVPTAVTQPDVREVGLAVRSVEDDQGRPQLQVLVLLGI